MKTHTRLLLVLLLGAVFASCSDLGPTAPQPAPETTQPVDPSRDIVLGSGTGT